MAHEGKLKSKRWRAVGFAVGYGAPSLQCSKRDQAITRQITRWPAR
jgi:hypothetical protein